MKISEKQIIGMMQMLQEYSYANSQNEMDRACIQLLEAIRNQQSEELHEVE